MVSSVEVRNKRGERSEGICCMHLETVCFCLSGLCVCVLESKGHTMWPNRIGRQFRIFVHSFDVIMAHIWGCRMFSIVVMELAHDVITNPFNRLFFSDAGCWYSLLADTVSCQNDNQHCQLIDSHSPNSYTLTACVAGAVWM